ncbi:unnamed protein product, partial [Symbiodinium sp. CCMP2456]
TGAGQHRQVEAQPLPQEEEAQPIAQAQEEEQFELPQPFEKSSASSLGRSSA